MTIALYPNKRQGQTLLNHLAVGRHVFNRALEERITTYKNIQKNLSYFTQTMHLTAWRYAEPEMAAGPVMLEHDALNRLDKAFKAFFRRLKEGKGPVGFPRFKSANRWHSFAIGLPGKCVYNGRIRVSKVDGLIRCRNLRPVVGTIRVQRVLRRAGKWFCQLVIENGKVAPSPVPVESAVGIDVGLNHFATLSTGETIENPRFLRKMVRQLRRDHQRVSRRKRGSRRRYKAILRLQRTYEQLRNHRLNFTHHISKQLVAQHQLIAVEDLNVSNMVRGRFAKSILDAGWSRFIWNLTYKAEKAGCQVVRVNPSGTSQECSRCGTAVPKDLSVRIHKCTQCGLVMDRDKNAALNILCRALETARGPGRGIANARRASISPVAVSATG